MKAIPRRQVMLVAGLAAVAVVVLILGLGQDTPAERAATPSNRAGQSGGQAVADVPVVDLRLERLHEAREELPESTRDPFRFRPKPPPPAPPRVAATPPPPRPPEFTPPSPVPTGPPPPPRIAIKFFGWAMLGGQRVATFSDARGNIFSGKEGDIIEGRYRILRIGTDSADVSYLDGRGRETIRLTGQ
jgi:hypothetical protein